MSRKYTKIKVVLANDMHVGDYVIPAGSTLTVEKITAVYEVGPNVRIHIEDLLPNDVSYVYEVVEIPPEVLNRE
jgi:hypothetical protein